LYNFIRNKLDGAQEKETAKLNWELADLRSGKHFICYVSRVDARCDIFEICDLQFSVSCKFIGLMAKSKLASIIRNQQNANLNILGLIGK